MVGDLLGSVGVIVAAAVIAVTGWSYADPLVAVLVALMILPRTFALGRSAVRILVQAAPEHLDVAVVRDRLAAVPGVCDVHDLHVWTLTSGMDVASAHLSLEPAGRARHGADRGADGPARGLRASTTRPSGGAGDRREMRYGRLVYAGGKKLAPTTNRCGDHHPRGFMMIT